MIKPQCPKDRIILALDVDTLEEVKELVLELKDYVGYFKIGLPLIVTYGFEAVRLIEELGGRCYYDSKFHDIPNTVQKACINLVKNNIHFFNIHIQGGSKMISGTVKAVNACCKRLDKEPPIILGVTLLSSFGQRTLTEELCVDKNIEDYVSQLAQVAYDSGLDGVVASADEAKRIRQQIPDKDFIIVCPATRPTWASVNDQVRVDTPRSAILSGVDYMVIGRPITTADNRIAAAQLILDEIATALEDKEKRKELYEKFAEIAQKYIPLEHAKKSAFICIIAKSPTDLIKEGEILHHCVGRMNYDQKFIKEESLIFFVRNKDNPDVPLVTLEYSVKNKKILQCYGDHDTKPSESILHYVNKIWLPYARKTIKQIA